MDGCGIHEGFFFQGRGRASRCVMGVGCTSPGGKITGVNCVAILRPCTHESGIISLVEEQQL